MCLDIDCYILTKPGLRIPEVGVVLLLLLCVYIGMLTAVLNQDGGPKHESSMTLPDFGRNSEEVLWDPFTRWLLGEDVRKCLWLLGTYTKSLLCVWEGGITQNGCHV